MYCYFLAFSLNCGSCMKGEGNLLFTTFPSLQGPPSAVAVPVFPVQCRHLAGDISVCDANVLEV